MVLAVLGALAIGLSLGLLGSGGSILTVPVLVYLLGQEEKVAIAGSLFVVGVVAAAGGAAAARRRLVDWRSVVVFGVPGMAGTWLGAALSRHVSGTLQLAVFAGVMLVAAVAMVRPPGGVARAHEAAGGEAAPRRAAAKVAGDGLAVGLVTGFVGVGGGFLIVPALVVLGGLPIPLAVGTSLTIIALKSATGFLGYLDVLGDLGLALDWPLLGLLSAVGVAGSLVGGRLGRRLPARRLRQAFAVFLVAVGLLILARSVPPLLAGS
ncbi:MAG TPA: sulfite exporter TauE/SafE family protein [Thermoanaerobaculia bacterium]